MAHIVVDGVVHFPKGRFGGTSALSRKQDPAAVGTKRTAGLGEGPHFCRRRLGGAGAAECDAVSVVTMHEAAFSGLVSAASEGEVVDAQVGQHLLGDAVLASDPAVCLFAVANDVEGVDSGEEFGLDVEGGLD